MFGNLGDRHVGWNYLPLKEVCVINPKKSRDNRLSESLEVSFVPMPAVSEKGDINTTETVLYSRVKSGFTYFVENDVLFAKITPCMENGKGAIAHGLKNGIGFGSTEFHVLRPISSLSNPYWLYSITSNEKFRKEAENNMTRSAGQRRVPAKFLSEYKVSIPPIELQNKFELFVNQVNKSRLAGEFYEFLMPSCFKMI